MKLRLARAAMLTLLASGCALLGSLFEKPTVTLRRVDVTDVSFSAIGARFVFAVENPNAIGADVARLDYQFTIDGHQLAEGHGDQAFQVPAHGTGEMALPVRIRFADFSQSLQALVSKTSVPYTVQVRLGFQSPAGIIEVPVSQSGSFPVPQLPDVRLASVSVRDMGLGGATLDIGLQLQNRNAFAVPLGGFSYRVLVEGAPIATGAAQPGQLAASATQVTPLAVRVDFLSAGLAVARALQGGGASVTLDGALDLGGFNLPVHLSQLLR